MKQILSVALLLLILCSCKKRDEQQDFPPDQDILKKETNTFQDPPVVAEASPKVFTYEEIAKYTVAAIMFQSPKIIKVKKEDELYLVSYVRSSDSQKFDYKIKFEGNRVIWGNSDGRWRDTSQDEIINFLESDDKLKIIQTFSDGSESVEEFTKSK